jgi:putative FmdB family regulatory protein
MPIYAFNCSACAHDFDRLQKLSDPDPAACPACGADAVRRKLTAPSFRLAGSGWYETDFKKDGDRKRNLAEGGEGAKPSADAATDAKPKAEPQAAPKPEASPAAGKPVPAESKPAAPAKPATP